MLKKYPIQSKSRKDLVYYICGLHNKVNLRLGKSYFKCDKAFDFWGGDCGNGKKGKNVKNKNNIEKNLKAKAEEHLRNKLTQLAQKTKKWNPVIKE